MNHTTQDSIVERRSADRRGPQPFVSLYQLGFKGRREHDRRTQQSEPRYVDVYATRVMFVTLGIVVLSALDAFFTLNLLARGAVEVNTVMAVLIEDDVRKFVTFKMALTSLAIIFLFIHHDYNVGLRVRVRHLKYVIFLAYIILISYEIVLLRVAYS